MASGKSSSWIPIILAIISLIGSVAVAYITTGKTFDQSLKELGGAVSSMKDKIGEYEKNLMGLKSVSDRLREDLGKIPTYNLQCGLVNITLTKDHINAWGEVTFRRKFRQIPVVVVSECGWGEWVIAKVDRGDADKFQWAAILKDKL